VQGYLDGTEHAPPLVQLIPVLLTIGAFGKSAQLFLYVWLPDAMEGPTPVSALIHAATMVTAGVYLVARFMPIYALSEWALPIVAWGGAITAFWSATIGMAQFDIKRIMAYSTVSQLGYMFAGLGVLGAAGGASHVFTHAFFKALLFLSCGAVMHGFAGQLDLRKLSGLRKMEGWKVVSYAMLIGCINLAGVPFVTAGFYSKDMILGDAFANHYAPIGWLLLLTAGMTAYYTFRVFFRVFCGPVHYEAGDELQGHDDAHADGHGDAEAEALEQAEAQEHGSPHSHGEFHPHPPGWAINFVLSALAGLSIAAIGLFYIDTAQHGWVGSMVHGSTAGATMRHAGGHEHGTVFGMDAHLAMKIASSIVGLVGILIAYWLHLAGRTTAATARADKLLPAMGPIATWAQHKWYVDELYHWLFYTPLRVLSYIFFTLDKFLVDGLVNLFGWLPRAFGKSAQPMQDGELHGYASRMVQGVVLLLLITLVMLGMGGLR
ncbi:MAG: proton-conducting transporter membrane subunit, partial [Phycisphaerales bacterium]